MTHQTPANGPYVVRTSRVSPQQPERCDSAIPLSLLDATTANFGLTSAIWLLERPASSPSPADLASHLCTSLSTTLNAYSQWCGHLKGILSIDGQDLPPETRSFPAHAKRYGRVYVHFGTNTDPGVEFVEATSPATVETLYNPDFAKKRPIWNRRGDQQTLAQFVPSTDLVHGLEPNKKGANGLHKPIMAVQWTELACGGRVLAAKIAHPLADIAALTRFVRDWGVVSRAMLARTSMPVLDPIFDPSRLDDCAAGNINSVDADSIIAEDAFSLPLHRYDWWAPPTTPPSSFPADLPLAGKPMPWNEWDTKAPVDQYTIHFSREQIDFLWQLASKDHTGTTHPPSLKISKHDALLAHVWSCVVRARGLSEDQSAVHCDLVLGTRPGLGLDDSFIGSPTMMLNIEMPARQVASGAALGPTAQQIRKTVSRVNDRQQLANHLHSIAYEKSPQRIWQAFLGRRHILVTTWARAGVYDIDFGMGSRIRYADGLVPCLDGCILIVDGPPPAPLPNTPKRGWADNGVEITIPLRCEDMQRLIKDPLLLPQV